jgi:hypothetical protein
MAARAVRPGRGGRNEQITSAIGVAFRGEGGGIWPLFADTRFDNMLSG